MDPDVNSLLDHNQQALPIIKFIVRFQFISLWISGTNDLAQPNQGDLAQPNHFFVNILYYIIN